MGRTTRDPPAFPGGRALSRPSRGLETAGSCARQHLPWRIAPPRRQAARRGWRLPTPPPGQLEKQPTPPQPRQDTSSRGSPQRPPRPSARAFPATFLRPRKVASANVHLYKRASWRSPPGLASARSGPCTASYTSQSATTFSRRGTHCTGPRACHRAPACHSCSATASVSCHLAASSPRRGGRATPHKASATHFASTCAHTATRASIGQARASPDAVGSSAQPSSLCT